MFPYVASQQGDVVAVEGGGGVRGGYQIQFAGRRFNQPCPAGTESAGGTGIERFLEGFEAAPFRINGSGQFAGRLALAFGGKAQPVESMVPSLCRIVKYAAGRFFNDFFQRGIFKFSAFDLVVQIGDVGLMVFAVVVFQGLFGQVRFQSIQGIRQFWQFVFHGDTPDIFIRLIVAADSSRPEKAV